ncbi:hypothetical protein CFP65_1158 [Kitasatospora sp. MMS16-BH015]|uniref:hypothetical protein n=1 Tax=Kitasatospora sp. MMS16-BH015 TaxID=2018025 RepID=UPI000CA11A58|nr:hypothetical protein [Kitasatospora sp. MMS16-BH015]AUG76068.1 hypothetical protein CFP65_1158 [Kitasatospora sp. MMS16-BH015]
MQKNQLGRLVGAVFGLVFILRNVGAYPAAVCIPLRALAILAFLWLFRAIRRTPTSPTTTDGAAPALFGKGYRLVVAAEVVLGMGGLIALNPVLHLPEASVGWISLVVGLHFFGLAAVWRRPTIHRLAAALTACGTLGLTLGVAQVPYPLTATIGGILPGVLLLASVARDTRTPADRTPALG